MCASEYTSVGRVYACPFLCVYMCSLITVCAGLLITAVSVATIERTPTLSATSPLPFGRDAVVGVGMHRALLRLRTFPDLTHEIVSPLHATPPSCPLTVRTSP